MKLAEVQPLIDKLAADALSLQGFVDPDAEQAVRLALESAFVAGVRSGLKFTSNAKFAEVFGAAAKTAPAAPSRCWACKGRGFDGSEKPPHDCGACNGTGCK